MKTVPNFFLWLKSLLLCLCFVFDVGVITALLNFSLLPIFASLRQASMIYFLFPNFSLFLIPPFGSFLLVFPRSPNYCTEAKDKDKSNKITNLFLIHAVIHHSVILTQKIFGWTCKLLLSTSRNYQSKIQLLLIIM